MMTVDCDYRKMKDTLVDIVKANQTYPIAKTDTSPMFRIRETIIRLIVEQLKKDSLALKEHRPVSALCQFCPSIRAIREKDKFLEETAQRIAWQLYDDAFASQMKWASTAEGDPFYKDSRRYLLSDTEISAIDVYRSIAERKYKNLLQNLRAEYSSQKISFMMVPTITPTSTSSSAPTLGYTHVPYACAYASSSSSSYKPMSTSGTLAGVTEVTDHVVIPVTSATSMSPC